MPQPKLKADFIDLALPSALPVFQLEEPILSDDLLRRQSLAWLDEEPEQIERTDAGLRGSTRDHTIELYTGGGLWIADPERLCGEKAGGDLLDEQECMAIALQRLKRAGLDETAARGPLSLNQPKSGFDQRIFYETKTTKRTAVRLNVHVGFGYRVTIPDRPKLPPFRTIGGGAKIIVKFGPGGKVVCVSAAMRRVKDVAVTSERIPHEDAGKEFFAHHEKHKREDVKVSLAYYLAPAGTKQDLLMPVYVFRSFARIGKKRVPQRISLVPAVLHGKRHPPPGTYRSGESTTSTGDGTGGRDEHTGSSLRRAAAFWIGGDGLWDLWLTPDNASGFIGALPSTWSWMTRWNSAALKSHWTTSDDTLNSTTVGADTCDIAFYTGHADVDGFYLTTSTTYSDTLSEVTSAGTGSSDRWGGLPTATISAGGRLRWIVIAACGPLEDGNGTTTAASRWSRAFCGLRMLLGYGGATLEHTQEGSLFMTRAKTSTYTIKYAWVQTGLEIQHSPNIFDAPYGPDVYVSALGASVTNFNDKLTTSSHFAAAPPPALAVLDKHLCGGS